MAEMAFLICDSSRLERGFLPLDCSLDFELGTDNGDAQLSISPGEVESGFFVICPDTEYGAVLESVTYKTNGTEAVWKGDSFRKLLDRVVIQPAPGEDYRKASGECNQVLKTLISGALGDFFTVSDENSGIFVTNYQFARYCTLLDGIESMLKSVNARLNIQIKQGSSLEPFSVELSAVKISDYSQELEWSEDARTVVTISKTGDGINHLICLGKGELKDREILHLYAWPDGTISKNQYYTGFAERQEAYDYSSCESMDELEKQGSKRLLELFNKKSMSVDVKDMDIAIGDIVGGRSYEAGISVQVPIKSKIVRLNDGEMTIELKTEGES